MPGVQILHYWKPWRAAHLIAANNNEFNVSLLQKDAYYFLDAEEVKKLIEEVSHGAKENNMIANNIRKIREEFTWAKIIDQYAKCIIECHTDKTAGSNLS